tara:strand:- start:98 stop:319 length:222 start_codon:yes stop_codon:yes gene_type:complete
MLKGKKDRVGFGMAMGIIVGTVIGAMTNNVGLDRGWEWYGEERIKRLIYIIPDKLKRRPGWYGTPFLFALVYR